MSASSTTRRRSRGGKRSGEVLLVADGVVDLSVAQLVVVLEQLAPLGLGGDAGDQRGGDSAPADHGRAGMPVGIHLDVLTRALDGDPATAAQRFADLLEVDQRLVEYVMARLVD